MLLRHITPNPSSWGSVTVAQKSHKLQEGGSIPPPATKWGISSIGRAVPLQGKG